MAYDPRAFNPGLVGGFIEQFGPDNPMAGDDFQHSWSGSPAPAAPGFDEFQDAPWMPDTDINEGKVGYSPRENFLPESGSQGPGASLREPAGGSGGGQEGPATGGQPTGPQAAPAQPRQPVPRAQMGVLPFKPMAQQGAGSGVTPRMNNLYGSLGGLKGGGLGLPLDPLSNQTSDPIDGLLQLLKKGAV